MNRRSWCGQDIRLKYKELVDRGYEPVLLNEYIVETITNQLKDEDKFPYEITPEEIRDRIYALMIDIENLELTSKELKVLMAENIPFPEAPPDLYGNYGNYGNYGL